MSVDATRMASGPSKRHAARLVPKVERDGSVRSGLERRLGQMAEAHAQDLAVVRADARDHAARVAAYGGASQAREDPPETADANARRHAAGDDRADRR